MSEPHNVQELVPELEERFWLEGGGDPDFWRLHCADDALVALPFGIMDKEQTVAAMSRAQPWARVEMRQLRSRLISDTSALVTYQAFARRVGDDDEYVVTVGSVYVFRGGSWLLLFHQQSPANSGA